MPDIQLITSQSLVGGHALLKPVQGGQTAKAWNIRTSPSVRNSRNPIRSTLASVTSNPPTTSKPIINLGIGDPTHYPLHPAPPAAVAAVRSALESGKANGYILGVGSPSARQAAVDYHQRWDGVNYDANSVVLTHGVGQALDLVFSVLFPPAHTERSNVLLPRPVFAQYPTLLASLGVEVRYYDCVEERGWEADLEMMEGLCDDETRAILVTNPSNPCGTNFSAEHLRDIVAVAERHKVPIIADEIYGHITWTPFHPLASLSPSVPILTLSGLSKRFLLPGWRVGWVALHDPLRVAESVREGMAVWANRFFGPSSLSQAALPEILATPRQWFDEVVQKVELNATITTHSIHAIPGLSCTPPTGALYLLVRVDLDRYPAFASDVDFCAALYREEAVFVLPGECFEAHGCFRIVLASPAEVMREVGGRLAEFCARYRVD